MTSPFGMALKRQSVVCGYYVHWAKDGKPRSIFLCFQIAPRPFLLPEPFHPVALPMLRHRRVSSRVMARQAGGGSLAFKFGDSGCSWEVASDVPWVTFITPTSGGSRLHVRFRS